jgi:hypothetical protein
MILGVNSKHVRFIIPEKEKEETRRTNHTIQSAPQKNTLQKI